MRAERRISGLTESFIFYYRSGCQPQKWAFAAVVDRTPTVGLLNVWKQRVGRRVTGEGFISSVFVGHEGPRVCFGGVPWDGACRCLGANVLYCCKQ